MNQSRDELIQRFEFTCEIGAQDTLRRYLRENAASPEEIDHLPFADLICDGSAQGRLAGVATVSRNAHEHTIHAYDSATASAGRAFPVFSGKRIICAPNWSDILHGSPADP